MQNKFDEQSAVVFDATEHLTGRARTSASRGFTSFVRGHGLHFHGRDGLRAVRLIVSARINKETRRKVGRLGGHPSPEMSLG